MPQFAVFRPMLLVVTAVCLVLSGCAGAEPGREEPSAPSREQISAKLAKHAEVTPELEEVRAILVAVDDKIVFEEYYGTDQDAYWGVQSVTKSVVSTLIGIALDEGLIDSLDDTLADLLPGYVAVMSPEVAGTTLRELLTMTAGFPSGDNPQSDFTKSENWVREILTHPESPPGGDFLYSNGTSHLLAAILEEATGASVLAYARSRLFEPLGIDTHPAATVPPSDNLAENLAAYDRAGFAWPVDPQGVSTGWWGIKFRPRDMLKLGQVFLANGSWEGKQVVPADWVGEATTQQVPADVLGDGYGYQWWTGTVDGDETFRAMGYGGQLIAVVPDRHLVVVTSTELRSDDINSRGIDPIVLQAIIEDAIVSRFD